MMDQPPVVPSPAPDSDYADSSKTQKVSMVGNCVAYIRVNKRHRNLHNGFSESEESERFRACKNAEVNAAKFPVNNSNELKRELKEVSSNNVVARTFRRRTTTPKANVVSNGEEPGNGELNVSGSGISRNKMELKMSKKIVVNKKPMTVKELFRTGLLDGVSVVYMGGNKKGSGLRVIIRDGGILCSCCLCNGRRVNYDPVFAYPTLS